MIKNNLKSLLIHASISITSLFVFLMFNMAQPKWASAEAAAKHHNMMMGVAVTVIVVATILYYLLGRKHLIKQGSIYKNLFSVSLTLILGVFLWIYAFNIEMIGNSKLWEHYSTYNGYSFFFLQESENNNPFVFLLFSFIPTIAMWAGLQRKRN